MSFRGRDPWNPSKDTAPTRHPGEKASALGDPESKQSKVLIRAEQEAIEEGFHSD